MLASRQWTITTQHETITSKNVILAVGSVPKKLSYEELDEIPIETALDPAKLAKLPLDRATVAVFGSSHSTMIALPNLLNTPVKKVINFYRSPLKYAVCFDNWTLFDDTGLKGQAADWARKNIDGTCPRRLERCSVGDREFEKILQMCDHIVYTVGFEHRHLPVTPQWGSLEYDPTNGILAPGLFGVGIAFPEYWIDPLGSWPVPGGTAQVHAATRHCIAAMAALRHIAVDDLRRAGAADVTQQVSDRASRRRCVHPPTMARRARRRFRSGTCTAQEASHGQIVGHRQPAYHRGARTGQDRSAHRCRDDDSSAGLACAKSSPRALRNAAVSESRVPDPGSRATSGVRPSSRRSPLDRQTRLWWLAGTTTISSSYATTQLFATPTAHRGFR